MSEVFDKNPDYDPEMAGTKGYNTDKYLFDPFMRGKNAPTNILSPGAMIKVGVVIADIVQFQTTKDIDENGDIVDKDLNTEKKDKLLFFPISRLIEMIFLLIMTVGIVGSCAFFAVQYLMTIFEFFILTSVGILFVPCILWDGTKSFAAKLVTLFLSYFFKLMLMILCVFWVFIFLLRFGMTLMSSFPTVSFLNLGYFFFAMLLSWTVTQNGPKLATALLNGTPDLSMGEFMRAAGTAAAGAYAAKKAVAGTASAVQKTGAAAHKGLQKGVNTFGGLDAMAKGVSSAVNAEGDRQGWSKGQRFAKTAGGVAGLIGQNIKNSASTFFTGVENKGSKGNVSNMGKGKDTVSNSGADGKQTHGDARDSAEKIQGDKLTNEKNNKPKPPAQAQTSQDTTPRFDGQRDT